MVAIILGTYLRKKGFLTCEAENCFVEVIKRAENGEGAIVRMYENKNRYTKTKIHFHKKISLS